MYAMTKIHILKQMEPLVFEGTIKYCTTAEEIDAAIANFHEILSTKEMQHLYLGFDSVWKTHGRGTMCFQLFFFIASLFYSPIVVLYVISSLSGTKQRLYKFKSKKNF